MKIVIEVIPHKNQRYPTVGDWQWEDGGELLRITVSALGDWRQEALIGVHELWEVLLCKHRGITQQAVDAFDMGYEKERGAGDDTEPGDSRYAPYRREHCSATGAERILAALLEVDWGNYEDRLDRLEWGHFSGV